MLNKRYSDFVALRNALRRANKEAFDRAFPGKVMSTKSTESLQIKFDLA